MRGVRVILKDTGGAEIARTTTDANGKYLFTGLDPGDYVVVFDTTTLPAGYSVTKQNASGATATNGSDADRTTGATSTAFEPIDASSPITVRCLFAPS